MKHPLIFFLLYSLFNLTSTFGQSGFIVQYEEGFRSLENAVRQDGTFYVADHIPFTDIFLLKSVGDRSSNKSDLLKLNIPFRSVSVCRQVKPRTITPDDPYYKDQWQYDILHAGEAWEFGTGGTTCAGDTIVMAVLNEGYELSHDDLKSNIWINHGEIPNDGIDNDNNGYIDDVQGLNTGTNTDKHDHSSHGLKVAGIMGARANNQKGVAGVNWTSKIMYVSYIADDFYILKGLHYILTQRRKYNESNGKEGAFVVSVNNSFGIPNLFPEDGLELWCNMYDSLGMAGIISVGSTTNSKTDVDVAGDIPSTCPSQYLIIVTNTDKNDKKVNNAGYGSKSVDIGAPGEGVFTVGLNNAYTTFTGTSASAPHVTGAVGLLYNINCCELANMAISEPAKAALRVKDDILKGATPLTSLNNITTNGGRLDLYGAATALTSTCGNALGTDKINDIQLLNLGDRIKVQFTGSAYKTFQYSVYNMLGMELANGEFDYSAFGPDSFDVDMTGLPPAVYFISIFGGKSPISMNFIKLK